MKLPTYTVYLGEPGENIHAIIERYWPAAQPDLIARCRAEGRTVAAAHAAVEPDEDADEPDTDVFEPDVGEPVGRFHNPGENRR